jgi:hypothetical protein
VHATVPKRIVDQSLFQSLSFQTLLVGRSKVYSQLSGLEDMVFNDFLKDICIPEGDGQVASGSASLPKVLYKFSTGWAVGVVKSMEKKKRFADFKIKNNEHRCLDLTNLAG